MTQSIKTILTTWEHTLHQSLKGPLVQILKHNKYFNRVANKFGNGIFQIYVCLLSYFQLSAGMRLIIQEDSFVVWDGAVEEVQSGRMFTTGMIIQETNNNNRFIVKVNTHFIRIRKTTPQDRKIYNRLKMTQKENYLINQNNWRLVFDQISIKQRLLLFQSLTFLNKLGSYDLKQLAIHSQIEIIKKQTITHRCKQQCTRIGYIMTGIIKVVYYGYNQPKQDKYQQYTIHKHKIEKDAILHKELTAGDWIGLQDQLSNSCYSSSGKVITQQAKIIWIDSQVFSQRVNHNSNYEEIQKVIRLIKAKNSILSRSLNSKTQKQQQIGVQLYRLQNKKYNNSLKNKSLKKQNKKNKSQLDFYQLSITHSVQPQQKKQDYHLPKIQSKINFFPEEFQKAVIPIQLAQQFKRLKLRKQVENRKNNNIYPDLIVQRKKQSNSSRKSPSIILKSIRQQINYNGHQRKQVWKRQNVLLDTMNKFNPQSIETKKYIKKTILNNITPINKNQTKDKSLPNTNRKTLQIKDMEIQIQ